MFSDSKELITVVRIEANVIGMQYFISMNSFSFFIYEQTARVTQSVSILKR
jgi:hypothetical protein